LVHQCPLYFVNEGTHHALESGCIGEVCGDVDEVNVGGWDDDACHTDIRHGAIGADVNVHVVGNRCAVGNDRAVETEERLQ
jgi:hypothetical protein